MNPEDLRAMVIMVTVVLGLVVIAALIKRSL